MTHGQYAERPILQGKMPRKRLRESGLQRAGCARRFLPAIQHAPDLDGLAAHAIVDCVRKALGKRAVIAGKLLVDARLEQQRIDVGEQRIQKVSAQTLLLPLVKPLPIPEIAHGDVQNLDLHDAPSRSFFLAVSQGTNAA